MTAALETPRSDHDFSLGAEPMVGSIQSPRSDDKADEFVRGVLRDDSQSAFNLPSWLSATSGADPLPSMLLEDGTRSQHFLGSSNRPSDERAAWSAELDAITSAQPDFLDPVARAYTPSYHSVHSGDAWDHDSSISGLDNLGLEDYDSQMDGPEDFAGVDHGTGTRAYDPSQQDSYDHIVPPQTLLSNDIFGSGLTPSITQPTMLNKRSTSGDATSYANLAAASRPGPSGTSHLAPHALRPSAAPVPPASDGSHAPSDHSESVPPGNLQVSQLERGSASQTELATPRADLSPGTQRDAFAAAIRMLHSSKAPQLDPSTMGKRGLSQPGQGQSRSDVQAQLLNNMAHNPQYAGSMAAMLRNVSPRQDSYDKLKMFLGLEDQQTPGTSRSPPAREDSYDRLKAFLGMEQEEQLKAGGMLEPGSGQPRKRALSDIGPRTPATPQPTFWGPEDPTTQWPMDVSQAMAMIASNANLAGLDAGSHAQGHSSQNLAMDPSRLQDLMEAQISPQLPASGPIRPRSAGRGSPAPNPYYSHQRVYLGTANAVPQAPGCAPPSAWKFANLPAGGHDSTLSASANRALGWQGHSRQARSEDFALDPSTTVSQITGPDGHLAPPSSAGSAGSHRSHRNHPYKPGHRRRASSTSSRSASSAGSSPNNQALALSEAGMSLDPPVVAHVTTAKTQAASASRRKGDANFQCPFPGCSSTFTRALNLKGHIRSHNDEKPFSCGYPGCDKAFARAHDLKRHQKLHFNIRPHTCEHCGKTFARLDALSRHHKHDRATCGAKAATLGELLGVPSDPDTSPSQPSLSWTALSSESTLASGSQAALASESPPALPPKDRLNLVSSNKRFRGHVL